MSSLKLNIPALHHDSEPLVVGFIVGVVFCHICQEFDIVVAQVPLLLFYFLSLGLSFLIALSSNAGQHFSCSGHRNYRDLRPVANRPLSRLQLLDPLENP